VEFICESPEKAYFMEMNTRIQVEHPVTELVTGLDLVALQIAVARGEPLPFAQADLGVRGWAVEARINAEDPGRGFAPAPGLVRHVTLPAGPFVRVDTHLYSGYRIPDQYDSMIAKVIAWGPTRERALARLGRALTELRVEGVPTTSAFHEALLAHPEFLEGRMTTRFIEENAAYFAAALGAAGAGDAGTNGAGADDAGASEDFALVAALGAGLGGAEAPASPPSTRWLDAARRDQTEA
jgi:acetyl-CoA carboxylase biotin carboxylase subunit